MPLTSFSMRKKYLLKIFWLLLIVTSSHQLMAESLTYSPDQWPRHWNILMNKANHQQGRNSNKYKNQTPLRSQVWGVVPRTKQKPRRSLRPEYDTNSHMRNYYSGSRGYASPINYGVPMVSPYGASVIGPGLAAPGVPFGVFPLVTPSPFMGGYPGMGGMPSLGYRW